MSAFLPRLWFARSHLLLTLVIGLLAGDYPGYKVTRVNLTDTL